MTRIPVTLSAFTSGATNEKPPERRTTQRQRAVMLEAENSNLRSRIELLERLAFLDALTGLPNRLALDEHIALAFDRACASGETLALAVADIDHFKGVNDRYGHAMGDAVLREMGAILLAHCRVTDLAARFGGEEFVVVLPGLAHRAAMDTCERLRRTVEVFDWCSLASGLSVTLSIGVSVATSGSDSPSVALALADSQMYRAKRDGRNRVCAAQTP